MPRSRNSIQTRARHKKWLKRAKGYRGRRSTVFKLAKEAVLKAGQHAFFDRRKKKADFRQRWQVQINAATREHGLSYSKFIGLLRHANIAIDRKVLAHIAHNRPDIFKNIIETARPTEKTAKK